MWMMLFVLMIFLYFFMIIVIKFVKCCLKVFVELEREKELCKKDILKILIVVLVFFV